MQPNSNTAVINGASECSADPPKLPASVVDVYCGAGGLSHGFVLEGFDVRAGIDLDPSCRYAYERNNHATFHEWDVQGLSGDRVANLFAEGRSKVLVGCAPCQPFSSYNHGRTDRKWLLLKEFGRLVGEVQPDIVSMENVARLTTFQGGSLFRDFIDSLARAGYRHWWDIVDCTDYGVPQARKRLVVLASRLGTISLIPPTHPSPVTVRKAIGSLAPIGAGQHDATDPLHYASRMSPANLARVRASKPGKSWANWPPELVAECHRKPSGRWYTGVYGRMSWDKPAPTITTQCYGFGNGRFGHPEQDRAISLREAALLQSFPRTYAFFAPNEPWTIANAARAIGNAVPVSLARAVAKSVAAALQAVDR